MSWGAVAGAVIGGVVSYASASDQADAAREAGKADPRYNLLLYGDGTAENPGLLGNASTWYENNRTGLNDQMRRGMNDQWSTYTDPALRTGYNNMSNLGSQLMNQSVAGNPFTNGGASLSRPYDVTSAAGQSTGQSPSGYFAQPPTQSNQPAFFDQPGKPTAQGLLAVGQQPQRRMQQPQGLMQQPAPQPTSPQPTPQPAEQPQGVPGWQLAQFGSGTTSTGSQPSGQAGGLLGGPFTAPPPPPPKPPAETAKPPAAAPYVNRPFDMQAYERDYFLRLAQGTLTDDDVHQYNQITGSRAG